MLQKNEISNPLSSAEQETLINAVTSGNLSTLMQFSSQQLCIFKDSYSDNLMHIAIRHSHSKIINHLLSLGFREKDEFPDLLESTLYLFFNAVVSNDSATVKKLLQQNGSRFVDNVDHFGFFPIHYAVMLGLEEMVDLLCTKDKDFAKKNDSKGANVLLSAAQFGHLGLVTLFLKKPELCTVNFNGDTVLHLAVRYQHNDVFKSIFSYFPLKKLLEKNNDQKTCLYLAVRYGNNEAVLFIINKYREHGIKFPSDYNIDIYASYLNGITKNSRCELVDLSRMDLKAKNWGEILPRILRGNCVKIFNVSHNSLNTSGINHLANYLKKNTQIETFILDGNPLPRKIYGSNIKRLVDALQNNTNLSFLSLQDCGLNDSDMEAISDLIRQHPRLKHLDLRRNPISDKGKQLLLTCLQQNLRGLARLEIDPCLDQTLFMRIKKELMMDLNDNQQQEPVKSDLFLGILYDLKALLPEDIQKIDNATKEKLLQKLENRLINKEEAMALFAKLIDEEIGNYKASTFKFKDMMSYHAIQQDLNSLIEKNAERVEEDEGLHVLKNHLDKQERKIQKQGEGIEDDIDQQRNRNFSQLKIHHFEKTLQRKLTMYWLTANCLETQLIEPSSLQDIEKTLSRIHIILGLMALLPVISQATHTAHGILGICEKLFESLQELVESSHLMEFCSELPGIHHLFHVIAEKWHHLGTLSTEHMLSNVIHAFDDFDACNEMCLSLSKLISDRYEDQMGRRLDNLEDAEKLATFTAIMILDFFKLGLYESCDQNIDAVLDWLFIAGKIHYSDGKLYKKQPIIHVNAGKRIKASELYWLPGIEFMAQDVANQKASIKCDVTIKAIRGKEEIKTNSPTMGHRKGSSNDAREFESQVKEYQQEVNQNQHKAGNPNPQYNRQAHYVVKFDTQSLKMSQNLKDIQAIPFTFLTKTQRLEQAEREIKDLKEKSKDLKEEATKRGAEIIKLRKDLNTLKAENTDKLNKQEELLNEIFVWKKKIDGAENINSASNNEVPTNPLVTPSPTPSHANNINSFHHHSRQVEQSTTNSEIEVEQNVSTQTIL